MSNDEAVKWLGNLKNDLGQLRFSALWHYEQALTEISELLEEQHEIVRCKDCRFFKEGIDLDGKPFTRCECVKKKPLITWGTSVAPDWFCGNAEKKDGEQDGKV